MEQQRLPQIYLPGLMDETNRINAYTAYLRCEGNKCPQKSARNYDLKAQQWRPAYFGQQLHFGGRVAF